MLCSADRLYSSLMVDVTHLARQGLFRWCFYRHDSPAQCYKRSQPFHNHAESLFTECRPEQEDHGTAVNLTIAVSTGCCFPTVSCSIPISDARLQACCCSQYHFPGAYV